MSVLLKCSLEIKDRVPRKDERKADYFLPAIDDLVSSREYGRIFSADGFNFIDSCLLVPRMVSNSRFSFFSIFSVPDRKKDYNEAKALTDYIENHYKHLEETNSTYGISTTDLLEKEKEKFKSAYKGLEEVIKTRFELAHASTRESGIKFGRKDRKMMSLYEKKYRGFVESIEKISSIQKRNIKDRTGNRDLLEKRDGESVWLDDILLYRNMCYECSAAAAQVFDRGYSIETDIELLASAMYLSSIHGKQATILTGDHHLEVISREILNRFNRGVLDFKGWEKKINVLVSCEYLSMIDRSIKACSVEVSLKKPSK